MKFKSLLLSALTLLSSCQPAHAQISQRPIFATSVYNGAGILYIPTSTPLANRACVFDSNSTIASSVTTLDELAFVHGTTSNLQAQIDSVTSGAVLSVFGRTGVVVGLASDYSAFFPQRANNLSDLTNIATARTNLGLGTAATQNTSAFDAAGSAAAAQSAAIAASDPVGSAASVLATSLQKAANLSDLTNASTARTNLGLGAAATQPLTAFLRPANNLSELTSASSARTNLGLGTAATQNTSAFDAAGSAATAQAASLQKTSNLSDLASASTARTNLGLGSSAVLPSSAFDAAGAAATAQAAAIAASDSLGSAAAVLATSLQKASNLSDLASASAARTNLGLGSAAVLSSSAFDAAGAAATVQAASLQKASNLSDLVSKPTARTNLGLGSAATQSSSAFDSAGSAAAAQAAAQAASDPLGSAATVQAASLQKTSNLSDLSSATVARANLGLGSAAVQATSAFSPPLTFISSTQKIGTTVALVNDAPFPGNFQVYGTDGFGLKGWYPAGGAFPGTGTVTDFLFTAANGFTGTVITATTTPTLTVGTSVVGIAKGDGTGFSAAIPGTDYQLPITPGNASTSTAGVTVTGTAATVGPAITVDVQTASTSQPGLLSAADWNTFSSKQSALTFADSLVNTAGTVTLVNDSAAPGATKYYGTDGGGVLGYFSIPATGVTSVSGTAPVVSSGGATPAISMPVSTNSVDGYLSGADHTTFAAKQNALSFGNLTDAGTDGITVTNGTGAVIGSGTSISQHVADATHSGFLASADWATFNAKQSALTPGNASTSTTGVTVTGTAATVGPAITVNVQTASTSQPGLLSSTDWNTFNGKQSTLSFGNLTDAGTDGITVTNGTGAVIGSGTSVSQHVADATHNGYLSSADWNTFSSGGGGGSGGVIRFAQTGGISVGDDIDSPHRFSQAATLTIVSVAMYNSGTSGSTTFRLSQWRSGVVITTVTGTASSNAGLGFSAAVSLSGTLNILTNDMISVDLTGVATGAQDISVEIDSGALVGGVGPVGPTGANGTNGTGSGPGSSVATSIKTTSYTVVGATDANTYIAFNCSTSTCTLTMPSCTSYGSYKVDIINIGQFSLTVASAVSDTFNGDSTMTIQGSNYNSQTLVCYGGTAYYVH